MKLKLTLALVALAGFAAAFAVAAPARTGSETTGSTSTGSTSTGSTTTGEHHHHGHGNSSCQHVELRGSNGSGSVAFTVDKASDNGSTLVGKQVTLTVPAGSSVGAIACLDAAGTLTLRGFAVFAPEAATTTTTTSNTESGEHGHHSHK